MADSTRAQRLRAEWEAIRALKKASSIFDFEATGDPPDRYTVLFRGQGLARDVSARGDVQIVRQHRCNIRLPFSYPQRGPDIRWLTPIFHPNVSFSGLVHLDDLDLPWQEELTLDVVCERLWDVARAAYLNLEKASNYAAKRWFAGDCSVQLPTDRRPLRDKQMPARSNIVRYARRDQPSEQRPSGGEEDVWFIGQDSPSAGDLPRRRLREDDDGILFIDE